VLKYVLPYGRKWAKKLQEERWCAHVAKSIETNHEGKATTLLNLQVKTDRTIPSNKLNIIIRNNEKGTRVLIDLEVSEDKNVIKEEVKMIPKYKDLTI
jgi:hypothetical protein